MNSNNQLFLGIEPAGRPKVSIIPIPLERTVSYGAGTKYGPRAIIEASQQVEHYDAELQCEPYKVGIELQDEVNCSRDIDVVLKDSEERISSAFEKGCIPFVLGGEHSVTPAAVRGILRHEKRFTVVQLDAHADLRDEYEGTPLSHASAMARVREILPAVQVGIRSLCIEEAHLIKENGWPVFFAHEMQTDSDWIDDAVASVRTDSVYITVDIDVFDSGILPQTGTPEPGGLGWYQVTGFLRRLIESKRVVGMDVVELAPRKGEIAADFMVAKLVYKMIGYWAELSK